MPTNSPSNYWGTSLDLSELRSTMDSRQASFMLSTLGRRIFGDKFDYSRAAFRTLFLPVIIGCPIHGEINISPSEHLTILKTGCPLCEEANGH